MAGSVNKATILGNVGNEPEHKQLPNDGQVVSFSIATSEKYKDKDGNQQEQTEWHRCVAFGKLAGIIQQYVKKGDKLYVEGKLKTRSYDDANGVTKYTTEIVVKEMVMIGNK